MTLRALRRREPAVLDDLLCQFGREIQAVAYLILRDRGEAEDVVAETLLAALDHGPELRDGKALRAWLLRIAANRAISVRRKRVRLVGLEDAPEPCLGSPDAQSVDRIALRQAIDELPAQMRAAIVLRYFAALSVQECGEALGKSPNTIKAQLQEALDRLRASVAERPPDRPAERVMEASDV